MLTRQWAESHGISTEPTPPEVPGYDERRYAFEWLDGNQDWDDVTCDA